MEGLICAIKRAAVHDGDGLRTTVFFKGCPLKCVWCHNPEGIAFKPEIGFYSETCIGCGECFAQCAQKAITMTQGKPVTDRVRCTSCGRCADWCPVGARMIYGQSWTVEALSGKLLQDRRFYELSGGGVTLSGGECLSQPEFATALAKGLYAEGISVYVDTCGFVRREVLEDIVPYTDTFLYDIKAVDPAVHRRCTGQDNGRILENLRWLSETGCRVEIRYPYVPGWNSGECTAVGQFLASLPGILKVKVLGYHSYAHGKYEALGIPCMMPEANVSAEELEQPVSVLRGFGLNAVNGMRGD